MSAIAPNRQFWDSINMRRRPSENGSSSTADGNRRRGRSRHDRCCGCRVALGGKRPRKIAVEDLRKHWRGDVEENGIAARGRMWWARANSPQASDESRQMRGLLTGGGRRSAVARRCKLLSVGNNKVQAEQTLALANSVNDRQVQTRRGWDGKERRNIGPKAGESSGGSAC
jgi:hypothetical protein